MSSLTNIVIIIGMVSIAIMLISIFLIPVFIKNIPTDYFINNKYHQMNINNTKQFIIIIGRNIIGFILIIVGVIMLFTPGPGIITILVALFLMKFKNKAKLEYMLVKNNATFKALNYLREKVNKEPFKR